MSSLELLSPKLREAKYPIGFDFTPLLKGQAIVSSTVAAINTVGGASADIVDNVGVSGGIKTVLIHDGVSGERYKITPSVTLTDGSKFEEDYILEVIPRLTPKNILEKQVAEIKDTGVFFASQLRGEIIDSVAFLAIDSAGTSADIIDDRGFENDLVSFRVRDGVDGQDYIITIFVTTEDANIYAEQVLVRVRNL